ELNSGFIPIRKAGKLPFKTASESYDLEYGSATVEIHVDACKQGDRVVILDDLIAEPFEQALAGQHRAARG
ncbi:hypothetical protein QSH86_25230, partial [Escherichia coli]|nr:hypothetical protein [Escherichia coli]